MGYHTSSKCNNNNKNNNYKRSDSRHEGHKNSYRSSNRSHPYASRHRSNSDEQNRDGRKRETLRKRSSPQHHQSNLSTTTLVSSPTLTYKIQPTTQLNENVFLNCPVNLFNVKNEIKNNLIDKNKNISTSEDARQHYNVFAQYYENLKTVAPDSINISTVYDNVKQLYKCTLFDFNIVVKMCQQLEQENNDLKNQNQTP